MKPTPTDPTSDYRPLNGHAVVPEVGVGRLLDATGVAMGRVGSVSDDITDRATRLAAQELADRADLRLPTRPGIVVRVWRRLFGRARPRLRPQKPTRAAAPAPEPAPDPTTNSGTQTSTRRDLAPVPAWMLWIGTWLERTVGQLPLIAPLFISGWFTAHAGHEAFNLDWPVAIALSVALEGGLWKLCRLHEKTLVDGDTTLGLRVGMGLYMLGIATIIYWHAVDQVDAKAPTGGDSWAITNQVSPATMPTSSTYIPTVDPSLLERLQQANGAPAIVVSLMCLAGVYLSARTARWTRRRELRDAGRVDKQLVRFSVWSWLLCPLETPAVVRYAVKHGIDQPQAAKDAYRAARDARRAANRATSAAKKQKQADEAAQRKADKDLIAADREFTAAADRLNAQADSPEPTPTQSNNPTPTRTRRWWRRPDSDSRPDSEPTPTSDPTPTVEQSATDPTPDPDPRPTPTPAAKPTPAERSTRPATPDSRAAAKPTRPAKRLTSGRPDPYAETAARLQQLYPDRLPTWNETQLADGGRSRDRAKKLRERHAEWLESKQRTA